MQQLLNPTRQKIVTALRGCELTVNDLMLEIGLTDNAIRSHLEALERQGLVKRSGLRRGRRKPHHAYKLSVDAQRIFFEGCEPLLNDLVAVLSSRLPPDKLRNVLREAGERLAKANRLPTTRPSTRKQRIDHAVAVLTKLGGSAVLEGEAKPTIRSANCPWALVTAKHPEVCIVGETLLSQLIGAPVKQHCVRGESPHCVFHIQRP